MSFEIIDNTFQVIVLAAMALLAFLLAFRRSSRSCLILAFGYASFMMGTLYYLLHLIILGHGPQVFYVAECSWMASYFFFLSLEILYWEGLRPPFSPFALAAGVVIAGVVMRVQVFGPSPLMSGALALTFGALAYLCFSALQKEKRLRPYEIALLFEMSLQILLFVASEFIRDYTRFNLYYAVDILLTLTLVSFLPHILREEPCLMKKISVKKLALAGMLCALCVVGSVFSFPMFGSKCAPIQHMVNVTCAVLLGPWWGVGVAFVASLLRNLLGLGSLMAFPGSMFGALLCGLVYHKTKNILATMVGEVFGTSILGGLCAYPVAICLMGKSAGDIAFYAYIVPFLISTAVGAVIAGVLVYSLQHSGALRSMQSSLS